MAIATIATGRQKELYLGNLDAKRDWEKHVKFDPRYLRPTEVDDLIGDASKARELLGWQAQVLPPELVRIMVDADLAALA